MGRESEAADQLRTTVYHDMRRLAGHLLGAGHDGATLQPTALVHEAYLRIVQQSYPENLERGELLALAAKVMRSVLVDSARQRRALKRGGDQRRVPLSDAVAAYEAQVCDLVQLDEALNRLADIDDRMARIVELRYFGGLSVHETAGALAVCDRTVRRDWQVARAWLRQALDGGWTDVA